MNATGLLAPAGFLLLFAVGIGLDIYARARQRAKRRDERFRAALDRHERMTFVDLSASGRFTSRPAGDEGVPLASRLFGYNRHRLDLYPYPPVVVITMAVPLALLLGALTTLMLGRPGLLLAVPVWPLVARMLFKRWRLKRSAVLFGQFPDALAMVVRGVRVGIPIGEAIGAVSRDSAAPTAHEFALVVEQLTIGIPLDEALHIMGERNDLPEYRFFATALSLQSQTGGNLSETLEGLADTIRRRVAARARGFALAAEARTSANVLIALPPLLFMALWFMNPNYVNALLFGRVGHMILAATLFLLGCGVMSMRLLIQKSLS